VRVRLIGKTHWVMADGMKVKNLSILMVMVPIMVISVKQIIVMPAMNVDLIIQIV